MPIALPWKGKDKDTLVVPISDLHSGGATALFPHYNQLENGFWQFKHTRYIPSGRQCEMAEHFDYCADRIAEMRDGKRLIIVENGDAIDGVHHHSLQLATHNPDEQMDVHVWLMQRFMKRAGFEKNKGDLLYVIAGTETHTKEKEDYIARELGAENHPDGADLFDFLELRINGRLVWFMHEGAGPGRGVNQGNALRNWMRDKYWERLEEGLNIPDVVISGHYHVPVYDVYVRRHRVMHGLILPSFQLPTRFTRKVAAAALAKVGIYTLEISRDGNVQINEPILMKYRDDAVQT